MDRRRGLTALLIVALDNYHRIRYLVQVYLDRFLLLILRLRPPRRTLITTPATRLGLATVQDLLQAYQVIVAHSLYCCTCNNIEKLSLFLKACYLISISPLNFVSEPPTK